MPDNDPLKTAKDGVALVGEIIKAAGDNPNVKEAGNNLGQTAVTLTNALNNVLLPLAAFNFGCEKARIYFKGKFQQDLGEKVAKIPAEDIVEPKASIAGPVLQGLAFAHEEQNLKDMYLNLLATAMDGRVTTTAHPAFVEIIKQLDGNDAALVRHTLQAIVSIPIVQLGLIKAGINGVTIIATHLVNLRDDQDGKLIHEPRLPVMIDNWTRLGLVQVNYNQWLTDQNAYNWVDKRPEFIQLYEKYKAENVDIACRRGIMFRTQFGQQFAAAVGLISEHELSSQSLVQRRGNKE